MNERREEGRRDRREETRHAYANRDAERSREADGDQAHDPAYRSTQQAMWVDIQVRQAIRQGEFDDLPGTGKPIEGLGTTYDPDWWAKKLIEREQITGLAPPAILLRREDAELDARLDREGTEAAVRRIVDEFNARVIDARRQLLGGPPVITRTRDADVEVAAWKERREVRRERQRRALAEARAAATDDAPARRGWRGWFSRRT